MKGGAKLNLVLAVVVGVILALSWILEPDPTRRNIDVLPGMVTPIPYESFTANPVLNGGVTQQTPPAGTLPYRGSRHRYSATPEGADLAGRELTNPYAADNELALDRGREVYKTYCELCHGTSGAGDGTVAQRGFPTPASLLATNARQMPDGRIFHIVSWGQGNMPGHASQIEPDDRWKAALWVRQLQVESGPLPGEAGDIDPGSPMDPPNTEQEDKHAR